MNPVGYRRSRSWGEKVSSFITKMWMVTADEWRPDVSFPVGCWMLAWSLRGLSTRYLRKQKLWKATRNWEGLHKCPELASPSWWVSLVRSVIATDPNSVIFSSRRFGNRGSDAHVPLLTTEQVDKAGWFYYVIQLLHGEHRWPEFSLFVRNRSCKIIFV